MHSYYPFFIRGIIQNTESDLFNFPNLTYLKHRIISVQDLVNIPWRIIIIKWLLDFLIKHLINFM